MTKYLLTLSCLLTFLTLQAQRPYYVLNEQFIDGNCGWTLSDETYVHQGSLHLKAYRSRSNPKMINNVSFPLPIDTQHDFKIKTAFIHDWGSNGSITNYFGLNFGQNKEGKGYAFYVTHEGEYYVALPNGHSVEWKATPFMERYVWNEIKVEKKGKLLRFMLNDHIVHETEFLPIAGDTFGLKIGNKNNNNATSVRVDYLEVTQPTSPDYIKELERHNLYSTSSDESEETNKSVSFFNWQGLLAMRIQQVWNRWAQKDQFETAAQYQQRMNQKEREIQRISERVADYYEVNYLDKIKLVNYTLHRYDADEQVFTISLDKAGDFKLKVPIEEAPAFKEAKDWLMFKNIDLALQDNQWVVVYVEVQNLQTKKTYTFDRTQTSDYSPELYGLKLDIQQFKRPN